jgi:hypothetical protein
MKSTYSIYLYESITVKILNFQTLKSHSKLKTNSNFTSEKITVTWLDLLKLNLDFSSN